MRDKEGNSMIETENIQETIKIKLGFYSGLGEATMKTFMCRSDGHQCREEKILDL